MGSCYSVGSNTRRSRLDHGSASVTTRPNDVLEKAAARNFSRDHMILVEAGRDSIDVGLIDEQSCAFAFPYPSKLEEKDEEEEDPMGSCHNVGSNTRYNRLDHGSALVPTRPKYFRVDVLVKATRNFSCDMMLAEDGPNSIYVGWIDERSRAATEPGTGTAIAVKKIYFTCYPDTYKEWKAEIKYLGELNHQNIVKLIGYCHFTACCRIHVYEFMPKGSLKSLLFRRDDVDSEPLSWNLRLNIAVGVAKGLAYLDTTKANIRDHVLTSSMVLIDHNYNAKLSNLQLERKYSKFVPPECKFAGNAKGEVYSFGVILLELLTGRSAYENVVAFAKTHMSSEENMLHIMDPSIEGQYSSAVATQAILLAMSCLVKNPKLRPDAAELVRELEQMQAVVKPEVFHGVKNIYIMTLIIIIVIVIAFFLM